MNEIDKKAAAEEVQNSNVGDAVSAIFGGEVDSLDKLGVMMIMDDIKSDTVRPVVEWIFKNNLLASQFENLTLIINSGGGSVTDAFALIDAIKGSGIPIHTIGLGEVSSAALMVFMAGEKGKRILTPNASLLSHQYTWGKFGKEHELIESPKAFSLATKMIMNHYVKCTGMTEQKIREVLLPPHDVWLSAKEAKKYGICDVIRDLY